MTDHADNWTTFELAAGMISVRLERIGTSFVDFLVTTTAPGRGGLYGGTKLRGDVLYINEYCATIAALAVARDYWRDKGHEGFAKEIDALMTAYCFDSTAHASHVMGGTQ